MLFTGLGLLLGRDSADEEVRQETPFPIGPPVVLGLITLILAIPVVRSRLAAQDSEALSAALAFLFVAPLGIAAGLTVRGTVLYAAVRRTRRLQYWIALLMGALAVPVLLLISGVSVAGPSGSSRVAPVLLLVPLAGLAVLMRLPVVRSTRLATPQIESLRRGLAGSLAMLTVGISITWLALAGLHRSSPREPEATGSWLVFTSFLLFAAGVGLSYALNSRVKRSGVLLGGSLLLICAVHGGTVAWLKQSDAGVGFPQGLVLLGLPAFLLGFGLVSLPRFYAERPPGEKILFQIPEQERRAPSGGAQRIGFLLIGIAVGLASPWERVLGEASELRAPLAALAAAGVTLVLFDSRAGIGRKLLTLGVTGALAGVGISLAL